MTWVQLERHTKPVLIADIGGFWRPLLDLFAHMRGRGFIQGIDLEITTRPIVEQGLAQGVLFNSTQDTVVRFLPPFLLQEQHVDKGIRILRKFLGKKRRKAA